jgi:heparosan-N-sulfate-glucuronate 5-epimerase
VIAVLRRPQLRGSFTPQQPLTGYYNDLTMKAADAGDPAGSLALARALIADRARANPVTIAQLGLGAWQLSQRDRRRLDTVDEVVGWLAAEMEPDGTVPYRFTMPHTFRLQAPWSSAMAQGEIASLFVRASSSLERPDHLEHARRAISPLLDRSSGLVADTHDGPVLQEYPTDPPAHVLNGWIFALWGIYDVAIACDDSDALASFEAGAEALAARLPLYDVAWGWSRYDLYPHRLVHVTSPFYQRLHVEQLRAMNEILPRPPYVRAADKWEAAVHNPAALALAFTRKVAFRFLVPRKPLP